MLRERNTLGLLCLSLGRPSSRSFSRSLAAICIISISTSFPNTAHTTHILVVVARSHNNRTSTEPSRCVERKKTAKNQISHFAFVVLIWEQNPPTGYASSYRFLLLVCFRSVLSVYALPFNITHGIRHLLNDSRFELKHCTQITIETKALIKRFRTTI